MSFPCDAQSNFLSEVYSQANQYPGAMYLHYSANKWAIKEYPVQWFDSEKRARARLISRNQPTVKG